MVAFTSHFCNYSGPHLTLPFLINYSHRVRPHHEVIGGVMVSVLCQFAWATECSDSILKISSGCVCVGVSG